jgi:hypothetical protein
MAFIFPEDKADFTASNGIVYHWDGTKWVVKAFRSTEDFVVDIGDDPPDNPKEGDLWYDTKADELTLYLYTGAEWVPAAPPVSLDGINATIDAALIVQNDLLDRVQAGEAEQNKLKLDIEELSITKGSVARYKITATNIGAAGRNGELYVNNAVAADVQAMSFAPFDLNGQPIKPCNVGDIVELVEAVALANVGEVCRYRILSGDSNALTVEYLSGTNNFEVDETQEVYIYPQNEAGASKDYVDTQVQLLDDKKLSLSGGTLTNSLKFNRGNKASPQFGIEPNSGTPDTNIYVFNDGQLRLRSTHTVSIDDRVGSHIVLDPNGGVPETKIYHVVTPTSPTMAANKAYVDAQVGSGGGSTSGLILDLWTYKGSKNNGNGLNDGEFGSKKMAGDVIELYLSNKNSRGVIYHPTKPNSTAEFSHQITNSGQSGSPMTVMHQDGRCLWYAETKKLVFNKGTDGYVMIEAIKYTAQFDLLVEGEQYMLNVAGFLSPVSGWS